MCYLFQAHVNASQSQVPAGPVPSGYWWSVVLHVELRAHGIVTKDLMLSIRAAMRSVMDRGGIEPTLSS